MSIKVEIEFIPVSERLPDKVGRYLCLMSSGYVETYHFSQKYNAFNTYDEQTLEDANKSVMSTVTHWAALPDLSNAKEKAPADYIWAFNHLRSALSEKQEERLQEIVNGRANESINAEQRRRELFEKVFTAMIHGGYYQDIIARQTKDPDAAAKALAGMAAFYAEAGFERAYKFARGE